MGAAGAVAEAVIGELTWRAAIAAAADRVLGVVGNLDRVEHRPAGESHGPAEAPVVLDRGQRGFETRAAHSASDWKISFGLAFTFSIFSAPAAVVTEPVM